MLTCVFKLGIIVNLLFQIVVSLVEVQERELIVNLLIPVTCLFLKKRVLRNSLSGLELCGTKGMSTKVQLL